MKNIILYDDWNTPDTEELKEWYIDCYGEDMDEDDISDTTLADFWYHTIDIMQEDLQDALCHADLSIYGDIIAIGDLGLWSGRVQGYNVFSSLRNVTGCCEDFNVFQIDRFNNLRLTAVHHDGVNHILFREMKHDLSDVQIDNFFDKLHSGQATKRDITRYTMAIGQHFDY